MRSESRTALVTALIGLALTACSTEDPVSTSGTLVTSPAAPQIRLTTLSTKPWLITGGDVLAELTVSEGIGPELLYAAIGDRVVSRDFREVATNRYQALLTDIPEGESELVVEVINTDIAEHFALTNYPSTGPIISGPQEQPYQCETEAFELVTGEFLGPALDESCSVETRVDYVYYSSAEQAFRELPANMGDEMPADMATLTIHSGEDVPFIVRVETGTVNRAIYEIAMLHDPRTGPVDPWNPSDNWNGKLVYTHGGGCRQGWYRQGVRTGGVMRTGLFEQGYAMASASLNVFGQNCNDLLASETHIMVKERFIEHYGVPIYTIGTGASGGSYQSHQTADNYPGVFDGIIVSSSFPDVTSATIFTLADARLLNYYFTETNPGDFSVTQQQAVSGFGSWGSIANLSRGAARLDPVYFFETPPEEQGGEIAVQAFENRRYHPSIPEGLRATVYDHTVNVYGTVDGTGIAQRPLDNRGVQYGLAALNAGEITPEQFISLNRDIGGFDRDMNHVPERHRADPQARKRAIESGRILYGGAGLAATPVIDYRSYTDHAEDGDIHMIIHQFSTRQRMLNANGHAANHVMQIGGRWGFTEDEPDLGELFRQMDAWLMAIVSDASDQELASKVVSHKPAALVDACWDNRSRERVKVEEPQTFAGTSQCNELYPAYSTPRHVAGTPLANDIVSCQLRPLNPADYAVTFTPQQYAQLNEIFPGGVCDWSRKDASEARHQGTWLSFGPSEVNRL